MLLASAAGVRVFVTGGIGGVHRGAERTLDVSADLTELGRTPVAVVCAGVKTVRPSLTCRPHTCSHTHTGYTYKTTPDYTIATRARDPERSNEQSSGSAVRS